MGIIISIDEFRKKRCLEALLDQIGLPNYCKECNDDELDAIEALFSAPESVFSAPYSHSPAHILSFNPSQNSPSVSSEIVVRRKTDKRKKN
jgi:hypothetical protein